MARISAVEAKKNISMIKSAVYTADSSHNTRLFIRMVGVSPSIKISGLVGIFKYEDNNYAVAEAME